MDAKAFFASNSDDKKSDRKRNKSVRASGNHAGESASSAGKAGKRVGERRSSTGKVGKRVLGSTSSTGEAGKRVGEILPSTGKGRPQPLSRLTLQLRVLSKWTLIVGFVLVMSVLAWVRINTPPLTAHQADQGYEIVVGTITNVVVLDDSVYEDDPNFPEGTKELQLDATLEDGRKIAVTLVDETGLYAEGVTAKFQKVPGAQADQMWIIIDIVRGPSLILLAAVFVLVVIALSRMQGVLSLVGLLLSGVIIIGIAIPAFLVGYDPIWIALVASLGVMWVTLPLSHGFTWTTAAAMLGTMLSLVLTVAITFVSVWGTSLTGLAQENIRSLRYSLDSGVVMDIRGLLVAGMIIGVLGILDDVTVAQSSTVAELKKANPLLPRFKVFSSALKVGRDHIAASVNTLFLAYAGAALPLLLLLYVGEISLIETVTSEMVGQEIVRTLAGSIGLVMAVPLTTAIAAVIVEGDDPALHSH